MKHLLLTLIALMAASSSLASPAKAYGQLQKMLNESLASASTASDILLNSGSKEEIFNCRAVMKNGELANSLMSLSLANDGNSYQLVFEKFLVPKKISLEQKGNGLLIGDSLMGHTKLVALNSKYSRGLIGKFKPSGVVSGLSEYIFRCVSR